MKISRILTVAVSAFALLAGASVGTSGAFAQGNTVVGTVGPLDGAVVVVRGAETFTLSTGDQIFLGDRVLTRTDGRVTLNVSGCVQSLLGSQSIVVDAEVCTKTPVALGSDATNVAQGIGGAGIGATPALLALAAVGGGAAAASGGNSTSP